MACHIAFRALVVVTLYYSWMLEAANWDELPVQPANCWMVGHFPTVGYLIFRTTHLAVTQTTLPENDNNVEERRKTQFSYDPRRAYLRLIFARHSPWITGKRPRCVRWLSVFDHPSARSESCIIEIFNPLGRQIIDKISPQPQLSVFLTSNLGEIF